MRADKTRMLFYNGNRLSDMRSLMAEETRKNAPPFFTRAFLFDVQGLKGRVLNVGEEIALADLKARLAREGVAETKDQAGRRGSRAHRSWEPLVHAGQDFL
jgi:hypothetical protein